MQRVNGPHFSRANRTDLGCYIIRQWFSLFYLPKQRAFQALSHELLSCQFGACGHFDGFVYKYI